MFLLVVKKERRVIYFAFNISICKMVILITIYIKNMKKKTNKIINSILYVLLAIVLVGNLFILIQAKMNDDKVPAIFGYKPFIVMSGSMESEIYTDDLIFVKTIDPTELKEKDIIAFKTDDNVVVTHRIVKILKNDDELKFTTKGDNNSSNDVDLVDSKDVEGKYVSRIPKLGKWFLFISKPIGMIVSILIAIVIIFIYAFVNFYFDKKNKDKEDEAYRKEFEEFKKNNPHNN